MEVLTVPEGVMLENAAEKALEPPDDVVPVTTRSVLSLWVVCFQACGGCRLEKHRRATSVDAVLDCRDTAIEVVEYGVGRCHRTSDIRECGFDGTLGFRGYDCRQLRGCPLIRGWSPPNPETKFIGDSRPMVKVPYFRERSSAAKGRTTTTTTKV